MLGVVIASILAVESVTATAAMAGLALHQEIQTADFIRDWHKDSHLLWQQQRDLDAQLATDVLNLQHTVSWLGHQLAVLSTRSVLKCDWNSSQFCITLVPFNMSPSRDEPRHINKKSSRCPSSREIPPSPQKVAG